MEVKVIEKTENPLLERESIRFEIEHLNAPTPSRLEVLKELSEELSVSEELIVIDKLATLHGRQVASGIARVYQSAERLEEFESTYLVKRTEVSREEVSEEAEEEAEEVQGEEAAKVPEEAEEPEKAEEKEEVEEEEEEEVEEILEEEEEKVEEASGEEIDYQELSDSTISEIKEKASELDLDYEKLLKVEKENKNRKTLKSWIEGNIENN